MSTSIQISQMALGNRLVFQRCLVDVMRSGFDVAAKRTFLLDFAAKITTTPHSAVEKAWRFARVLNALLLSEEELGRLAPKFSELAPELKNAAVSALPEQLRPLVYGKGGDSQTKPIAISPAANLSYAEPPFALPAPNLMATAVALLANDDQAANIGLLEKSGFGQIRVTTLDEFVKLTDSDTDICACVVDGSFLSPLPVEKQLAALNIIFKFSNFTWIRIHRDGLHVNDLEVAALHKKACCDPRAPDIERLSLASNSRMQESELIYVQNARSNLTLKSSGRITPAELSGSEADILLSALSKSLRSSSLESTVAIESVRTTFLPGGRTDAKVAQVKVDNHDIPYVAKVDKKTNVLEEAGRFWTYITGTDSQLRPETYFHQDSGVIIFGLVPDGMPDVVRPAPTLEQILRSLWNADLYPGSDHVTEDDAFLSIDSAASKISIINKQRVPSTTEFASISNPHMGTFEKTESRGLNWGLSESHIKTRKAAQERLAGLRESAVVHGDVHLRNILIRAGREAHLIDYARSGRGHPAVDLVRLELALYLSAFKQLAPPYQCTTLQRELSDPSLDAEHILSGNADLSKWRVNRVCIRGMVAARDAVLKVLKLYGCGIEDYRAMKCLVAWEGLLVNDLQFALAVTVLDSLSLNSATGD